MSFQIVHIPDLPAASSLTSTDQFPVENVNGTQRISQSTVDTYTDLKYLKKNVNDSTTGILTAAGFNSTSTILFKENIKDLTLEDAKKILKLTPVSFTFKTDSPVKPGQQDIGLIAEQVREILPQLVSEDVNGNLSIDYSKISVYLLLLLQQLIK